MKNEHERQEGESDVQYQSRVSGAWRTGTKIQSRCVEDTKGPWRHVSEWTPDTFLYWGRYNYRIAPGQQEKEPAKAREWYMRIDNGLIEEITRAPFRPAPRDGTERVMIREVLPGDDVEALRAELAQMDSDRCAAIADATAAYSERNAAEQARDNALSAVRDMRAGLDKASEGLGDSQNKLLAAERRIDRLRNELGVAEAVIRINSRAPEQLQAEIAELKAYKEATGRVYEMHGKAVLDLLAAQSRIIALQDELAASRNETATLAAKLTEATR